MPAKPTTVAEKLLKLAAEIADSGSANLTRLTVMKKWFDGPQGQARIRAFGAWIARRAILNRRKANPKAAALFREARAMLRGRDRFRPAFSPAELEELQAVHGRLRDFQNTYHHIQWGAVREIKNWDLLLVEEGLALLLRYSYPTEGYRLAADYCQHYDPHYGNGLNGPSGERILEIARFMRSVEAAETPSGT